MQLENNYQINDRYTDTYEAECGLCKQVHWYSKTCIVLQAYNSI